MQTQNSIIIILLSLLIFTTHNQTICSKNCDICSTSTSCTVCSLGYYPDTTSQCRPCSYGCLNCTAPPTGLTLSTCVQCLPNFNLNFTSKQCFLCSLTCKTCIGQPTNCTSCYEGTVLQISNLYGKCYRDPSCKNELCVSCKNGSPLLCNSCKSGYFLTVNQSCSSCPFPCIACQYSVNHAQIINQFYLGIQSITFIIDSYNEYIFELVDVMNRYNKYITISIVNPTVTFDIFLSDTTFPALGNAKQLNFTGADFNLLLQQASPHFSLLVDNSFFTGIASFLNMRISNYTNNFAEYLKTIGTNNFTINQSNQGNINNYLGFNWTDTENLDNITDWREYFGEYQPFFGNSSESKVSLNMFYTKLYNQTSFRQYFNGTLLDLIGANSYNFFNFQSAPPNCITCVQGFFFDSIDSTCKICSSNCVNCIQNGCTQCIVGYYLMTDNTCGKCDYPCLECSVTSSSCLSCVYPYTYSSGSCLLCNSPCSTCSTTNSSSCIDCFPPYSSKANSGSCYRCAQDICATCSSTNTSICIQCANGYSLANGVCQTCPAKCLQCSAPTLLNSISNCYKCLTGFVLNATSQQCTQCGQLCLQCSQLDSNICLSCSKGSYLASDSTCKLCLGACIQCVNDLTCSVYKDGVLIFGGQIVSCRPGCKTCDTFNPQKCIVCQQKFILYGINCLKCATGCSNCDITNPNLCSECSSDRFLDSLSGKCISCPQNCTNCDSNTVCKGCKRGFILTGNSCVDAASVCPNNCLKCANKICSQCNFGYVISSAGKCVKCVSSCGASCDASNPLVCTGCTSGFQSKQGKCIRCPNYCSKCSAGICSECTTGYELTSVNLTMLCVKSCLFPCKKCDKAKCNACAANFTLSTAGICEADPTCGGKGCLFCPLGSYKKESGDCSPCSNNCASCSTTDCFSCRSGYYLNSSKQCQTCPQGSLICLDEDTSTLCHIGYLLEATNIDNSQNSLSTFSSVCKKCESPCLQCMILANLCVSCVSSDYRLNGTTCLKKQVVGTSIRFNINYTDFLLQGKAQLIIDQFVSKTGANVVITFIAEGSTIFGVALSNANPSISDSTIAQSVTNLIGSGNLGPVIGSSVGVFFQDQSLLSTAEEQSKIGMIVGIVLGVVALTIIAVIAIFKLRKPPQKIQIKPESTTQLIDLRLKKKNKSTCVQYSTLQSFANNSKVLFS